MALDYGDVIVHVFDETAREYYDLEHLWSAAPALRPAADALAVQQAVEVARRGERGASCHWAAAASG